MLTRSCCCGGCFEVDDCPLAYGGLGDFTYTANIDISGVLGTFVDSKYTSITLNTDFEPNECYAFAYIRDKCCATGTPPDCVYPVDTLVDKYWDSLRINRIDIERTTSPCFFVARRPDSFPWLVKVVRCNSPKTVTGTQCIDVGTTCLALGYPCDTFPGSPLTQLAALEGGYAQRTSGQLCGELTSYVLEDRYEFGPLTKGGGDIRMRRNSQTTFTVDQTSGTGLSGLTYLHRANICPGATQASCGPCTLGGNGGTPCAAGRCCCRSLLDVTIQIVREYRFRDFAWNSFANTFLPTVGPAQYETQTLRLIYEGPVDERLYRVTGTAAQRTFTLLRGAIAGSFNLSPPPLGFSQIVLNHCPFDRYGLPGDFQSINIGGGPTVVVNVTDECQVCQASTPPSPNWLSMETLEALGVSRNIIVTRQTP